MHINFGISVPKWSSCAHSPVLPELDEKAKPCENCRLLQQLTAVYHTGQSRPTIHIHHIRRLNTNLSEDQRTTNVVLDWLRDGSNSPNKFHVTVPSSISKRLKLDSVVSGLADGTKAKLVISWPFIRPFQGKLVRQIRRSATDRTSLAAGSSCWGPSLQKLILRWLRLSCAKQLGESYHEFPRDSNGTVPTSFLPTRLLDLDPGGLPGASRTRQSVAPKSKMRLWTTPANFSGRFLTLSHRWGTHHCLKLTAASLSEFSKAIHFNSLPKTYQDAVLVTRDLGYRYLWIDALCIIQDDAEDWARESKSMAAVYNNSSCTIAAHNAHHDDAGFLSKTNTSLQHHLTTDLDQTMAPDASDFAMEVRNSILSSRGWVFQEMILSRRLLHFTDRHVFMEDGSGVKVAHRLGKTPQKYCPLTDNKVNVEDGFEVGGHWYRLVERFTRCELTFESDRLYALAGLAKHYGQVYGNETYLAGIWGTTIHLGLLWVIDEESPRRTSSDHYGTHKFPSWSWGSWSGRVKFPHHLPMCQPLCHIDGSFSDKDLDEDGQTSRTGVGIVLRAWLCELSGARAIRGRCSTGYKFESVRASLRVAYGLGLSWGSWVVLDGEEAEEVIYPKVTLALVTECEEKKIVVLETEDGEDEEITDRITKLYYFLVLTERQEGSGLYQRVGVGAVYGTSAWNNSELRSIQIV